MRKIILRSLALLLFYSLALLNLTSPVYAQPIFWGNQCVETITVDTINGPKPTDVATIQGLECVFYNISATLIPLAGIAVFVMLMVGALKMITAGGEPKAVQKASQTITFAVVGLVALLGIWFVLKLIFQITGIDVTKFKIPS